MKHGLNTDTDGARLVSQTQPQQVVFDKRFRTSAVLRLVLRTQPRSEMAASVFHPCSIRG